jgi:phosphoenolpyruvate synthase/pyruvate phosphate dikinase
VRAAVDGTLARSDLTNPQKASLIRKAWDAAQLPDDLMDEVKQAYRQLGIRAVETWPRAIVVPEPMATSAGARGARSAEGAEQPFVAVRSSASEEDLEAATRAGEFDTFLFVRGEDELITHLKRAWSGLWSERALHNRAVLGLGGSVGGGILVQRMVSPRASGVLHTVNVAERRLREMVINAGLGLGEGIVSGAVAADRIIVSKEGGLERAELHFRYLTADKRERFVFNSRLGSGTARVETLYHQRLRPALEYVEICQLVRAAARLEAAYGYPLDVEFAVEGTALFLLQVRPIPTPFGVWRDTIERWPLARPPAEGGVRTTPTATNMPERTARGG